MAFFIGNILPYVTIVVFVVGIIQHIKVWRSLPAPGMTLTPAPKPGLPRAIAFLKETLFFRSLLKGDKSLWFFGWIFHIMLALIFIGHLRVIALLPDRILMAIGMTPENIDKMSYITGGTAGVVILIMLLVLFGRRLFLGRVREISSQGDFIALLLILVILVTGDAMRFFTHFDLSQTRGYFTGFVTFSAVALPANKLFITHYFFAQLLIMYMPYSKLLHFGGIFFSEALIQKQ
jgi:nitrate reductase gamma subunit